MSVVAGVLVLVGTAVMLLAAVGLLRFPDAYTRSSAVATATGTGLAAIILGVALQQGTVTAIVLGVAAVIVQLAASGMGGTVLGRGALLTRHRFAEGTDLTDLPDHPDLPDLPDPEEGGGPAPGRGSS